MESLEQFGGDSPIISAWLRLAETTFARDWDNEIDAVYDGWRETYGVEEGEQHSPDEHSA